MSVNWVNLALLIFQNGCVTEVGIRLAVLWYCKRIDFIQWWTDLNKVGGHGTEWNEMKVWRYITPISLELPGKNCPVCVYIKYCIISVGALNIVCYHGMGRGEGWQQLFYYTSQLKMGKDSKEAAIRY